jgi:hypothetical protein
VQVFSLFIFVEREKFNIQTGPPEEIPRRNAEGEEVSNRW